MKSKLLITIALCLALSLLTVKVLAQTPTPGNYDVTVNPIFFDLTANPGDTLSTKVRIRNNTTSPLPIKLSVKKMSGDLNGNLTLTDDNSDGSLSWITFTSNKITLNPLEWTDVPFTITIPKSAAYGYYFAVTFTQDNTSPLKRTGAAITGAAAVPILLNVKKEGAKREVKITEFSVDQNVTEYLPVNFTIKVENQGNVHAQPHGDIFITDGKNQLADLNVNPYLSSVIPNAQKVFNASWDDGFLIRTPVMQYGQQVLDKNGKPVESLTINWNKLTEFRIGKYTANLLLVYDNGQTDVPLEASISFWVVPYKAIAVILVSLVVLILLVRFLLKFYISREVRRRMKTT